MKVVYGYRRDGDDKPILIRNCKFEYDCAKGRVVLANYDITAKFKEAEAMEAGSPYALAVERDQCRRFIRFAEKKQAYPMKMGLYVDRDGITMDVQDGKPTIHCRLTPDIAEGLRTDCPEKWVGWDLAEKSVYAEDRK